MIKFVLATCDGNINSFAVHLGALEEKPYVTKTCSHYFTRQKKGKHVRGNTLVDTYYTAKYFPVRGEDSAHVFGRRWL